MKRLVYPFLLVAVAAIVVFVPQALAGGKSEGAMVADMAGQTSTAPPVPPPMVKDGTYQKPPVDQLKKSLTQMEFYVTQQDGTEPPFQNKFWDNHKAGIYVDVVSGEPLFSSTDKFDSGTGWPSFTKPLAPGNVVEKVDHSLGMTRTEVRSYYADSHLGHLFNDGPAPTGLRYCIDSAALKFIPVSDLQKDGYGEYLSLFKEGSK